MTSSAIPRRQILQWAAVGAAGLYLPRRGWSQVRLSGAPFSLGVASGSPTHDSVVLWTRLMQPALLALGEQSVNVRWEVAHDEKFTRIAQSGQSLALAGLAYSVHAEVQGLEPDRWYFYRFRVGDAVSGMGRTRTFPRLMQLQPGCAWLMHPVNAGSTATFQPTATWLRKIWIW